MKNIFILIMILFSMNFASAEGSSGINTASIDVETFNALNNESYMIWAIYVSTKPSYQEAVNDFLFGKGPGNSELAKFHESVRQFLQSSPFIKFESAKFMISDLFRKSLDKTISPLMRQTLLNLNSVTAKASEYSYFNDNYRNMLWITLCYFEDYDTCDPYKLEKQYSRSAVGAAKVLILSQLLYSAMPEDLCQTSLSISWANLNVDVIAWSSRVHAGNDTLYVDQFQIARRTVDNCNRGAKIYDVINRVDEVYDQAKRFVKH